jgi:signal peptidase I
MANWLKYLIAIALALLLMLAVRALAFSIHTVNGNALNPLFKNGDHLLVNRCSYGLRIEGHGLLPYSRLMRSPVKRGDIVAFSVPNDSIKGLMIARCAAVPGDTIRTTSGIITVPGLNSCAKTDYYWLESVNQQNPADSRHLGFIPENNIVGRVVGVVFNRKNVRLQ